MLCSLTEHQQRWLLADRLFTAKMCVDSILYLAQIGVNNIVNPYSLNIKGEVDKLRRDFYVECADFVDELLKNQRQKKSEVCQNNSIIRAVYYERDKNSAHHDPKYVPPDWATSNMMAECMMNQLYHIFELGTHILPDEFKLNFVTHDARFFRIVHGVSAELEQKIMCEKYPDYGKEPIAKRADAVIIKCLNHVEDLLYDKTGSFENCGTIFAMGLNWEESLQNLQRACITVNFSMNQHMWVFWDAQLPLRFRSIGLWDEFDRWTDISLWTEDMFQEFRDVFPNFHEREFRMLQHLRGEVRNRSRRREMLKLMRKGLVKS